MNVSNEGKSVQGQYPPPLGGSEIRILNIISNLVSLVNYQKDKNWAKSWKTRKKTIQNGITTGLKWAKYFRGMFFRVLVLYVITTLLSTYFSFFFLFVTFSIPQPKILLQIDLYIVLQRFRQDTSHSFLPIFMINVLILDIFLLEVKVFHHARNPQKCPSLKPTDSVLHAAPMFAFPKNEQQFHTGIMLIFLYSYYIDICVT